MTEKNSHLKEVDVDVDHTRGLKDGASATTVSDAENAEGKLQIKDVKESLIAC